MTQTRCPFYPGCLAWFNNQQERELHLLQAHSRYKNLTDVLEATRATMEGVKANVYELLLTESDTRGDYEVMDNRYYLRYHSQQTGYLNGKVIRPFKSKGVPSTESINRACRAIQEASFNRIDNPAQYGEPSGLDYILIPAERIAARRAQREGAMRKLAKEEVI